MRLFAMVALLEGCALDPAWGELGRVELVYDEGVWGCWTGCDARAPLAVRGRARMLVLNDEDLPRFVVESADPDVLAVSHEPGQHGIGLEGRDPGEADLVFTDLDGTVLDRFGIEVAEVRRIQIEESRALRPYLVMVGGSDVLHVVLRDGRRRRLAGVGAVDYTVADGLAASQLEIRGAASNAFSDLLLGENSELAYVRARSVGAGTVVVSAPSGASTTLQARVVDASDVAWVDVERLDEEAGLSHTVDARAYTLGLTEIHSPDCRWTFDDDGGPVEVQSTWRSALTVFSAEPGKARATCTVGATSGTGRLVFR